jgi:fatty-acyl-CoA synthase
LRRGDAAAFSIDNPRGGEAVVVLVQCRTSAVAGRDELRAKVAAVLQRMAAVEATIVLVPPKMLPQTSSGKLSRSKAKANFLSGIYATDAAATEPMPSKPSA